MGRVRSTPKSDARAIAGYEESETKQEHQKGAAAEALAAAKRGAASFYGQQQWNH